MREIFVALTQYYKNSQFLKFDFENKIQDNRSFNFNSQIDNYVKFNYCIEKSEKLFQVTRSTY